MHISCFCYLSERVPLVSICIETISVLQWITINRIDSDSLRYLYILFFYSLQLGTNTWIFFSSWMRFIEMLEWFLPFSCCFYWIIFSCFVFISGKDKEFNYNWKENLQNILHRKSWIPHKNSNTNNTTKLVGSISFTRTLIKLSRFY